ncbi:MAG: Rv3654c family TadE-like protein [Mycobacteriaceae bacterium]
MNERGSASVFAAMLMTVLLMVLSGGFYMGSAIVARHRAQAAADLSALAGASKGIEGQTIACAFAKDIAARNDAQIRFCAMDGGDVLVAVEVRVSFGDRTASAAARAGPM